MTTTRNLSDKHSASADSQKQSLMQAIRHDENNTFIERLATFIDDGHVVPLIGRRFMLDDVPEAMRQLAAGTAVGKTAISVRPGVGRSQ